MPLLTKRWFNLRPHPEQNRLLASTKRYKVVLAGRGSGKTELAKRYLVMQACATPGGLFFYVAPTLPQAKNIAWRDILDLIPPEMFDCKWENVGTVRLTNGAEIRFMSGEKPQRLEGVQWNGGVVDESADEDLEKLFFLSIEPALTHKRGWCWIIGIPKRKGIGAKKYKELFIAGQDPDDEQFESFHWLSRDIVPPGELELRRKHMSPADFREQYEASWESVGGVVFPDFSSEPGGNVRPCEYDPTRPIIVGSDFNVSPMAWTLSHFYNEGGKKWLETFNEIWLRDTMTTRTLDHLAMMHGQHKAGWIFMGDATSRARKTSASVTDYVHIANDKRFQNKRMLYPPSNPPARDKISTTNAAILNAAGERRLFIDPRCKNLIADFTYLAYDEHNEPNKEGDFSHMTDAHGYVVWGCLPMQLAPRRNTVILGSKSA